MAIWKPLTCHCEIEMDGEKWISTIKKCSLHEEYGGQKLLNEVRKHNIENSPKAEQRSMEFEIRAKFEPDWMKEVSDYPSLEKISEAKFNLESMRHYNPVDKEFQYTLSNFLSSTRSIFWYLIKEYMNKFTISKDSYFKYEDYRKKHIKSLSPEGQKFVNWYVTKFEQLRKEKSSFLIDKRDFNIHHGYVEQIFVVSSGPKKVNEDQIKNGFDVPMDLNNTSAFFPEDKDSTVIELCKEYLDNVEKLVNECHKEFPIN